MRAPAAQIAQGLFTAVDAVGVPSSAVPGSTVNISITVRSLYGYVPITVTAVMNGAQITMSPGDATPGQGQSQIFTGSFVMPGQTATMNWYVWYYSAGLADWELDGQGVNAVQVQTSGGMWSKLASQDVNLGIGTTAGWNKLASLDVNLAIASPPTWKKLSSVDVVVSPGFVIPAAFKVVLDTTYPAGKTYKGKAEQCIASFNVNFGGLPPTRWYAEKLADNFANEVKKQGGTMLSLKLYEYQASLIETQYIIVAVAAQAQIPRGAVGYGQLVWAAIILAALIIIAIIAFTLLIREIKTIDWTSPGGLAIAGVGIALALAAAGGLVSVIAASRASKKAG